MRNVCPGLDPKYRETKLYNLDWELTTFVATNTDTAQCSAAFVPSVASGAGERNSFYFRLPSIESVKECSYYPHSGDVVVSDPTFHNVTSGKLYESTQIYYRNCESKKKRKRKKKEKRDAHENSEFICCRKRL